MQDTLSFLFYIYIYKIQDSTIKTKILRIRYANVTATKLW